MPNKFNEGPIELVIRNLVRDELKSMFNVDQENTSKSAILSTEVASRAPRSRFIKARRGNTVKKSASPTTMGKGRVTNPSDKRLKQNRELSGNA